MDSEVVDEDSIDAEALQAQIDLSMSFAQNLVSSWMEPLKLPPSPRKRDLEKELSEYMKRPPRLGVGASVPEGHQNLSREAARLKGKLTGSGKRLRQGEDAAALRRASDDDDEDESRAGAIKKKQKPDPFAVTNGKKKKKPHLKSHGSEGMPMQSSSQNAQDEIRKPDSSVVDTRHSSSEKLKLSERESLANEAEDLSSPQISTLKVDSTKNEPSVNPESVLTSPSRHLSESDKTGPTSPTLSSLSVPRNPIHAELLKRPLLNLTGPPANSDDEESETGAVASPSTSPKKKRRRRKKKHPIAEQTGHSTTTATGT